MGNSMREFIKIIEAESRVKDKTNTAYNTFADPTSQGDLTNTVGNGDIDEFGYDDDGNHVADLPGRKATAAKTRASVRAPSDERSFGFLSDLARSGMQDDVVHGNLDTLGSDTVPVNPENLPTIISTAVAETGAICPEWHMVRNLPGYMQSAIRAMGRAVFAPFTNTPIENIQVVSTLSNPEPEVRAMMNWIRENGRRDDEAELHFHEIMPGYGARTQIWTAAHCTFMLVQDHAGYYVYGWPENSRSSNRLKNNNNLRLR